VFGKTELKKNSGHNKTMYKKHTQKTTTNVHKHMLASKPISSRSGLPFWPFACHNPACRRGPHAGKRHVGPCRWRRPRGRPTKMCGWQCCGSGSGAFLPPGSGMNFFRIPDPEVMFFGEIFFRILVLLFFV
jgi:hypothetical protein